MGAGLKTFRRSSALALWAAALVTAFIGVDFFANGEQAYSQPLWTWMSVGDFNIGFNTVLDGLSLTMLSVVTGVGFLIHMYASGTCAVKGLLSLLRLHQPVHRQHGSSGSRR